MNKPTKTNGDAGKTAEITNPILKAVREALLPLAEAATAPLRSRNADDKVAAYRTLLNKFAGHVDTNYQKFVSGALAIATGIKEIADIVGKSTTYPLFTVLTFDKAAYGVKVGEPLLQVHMDYNYVLDSNGNQVQYYTDEAYPNVQIGNADDVKKCVENLNVKQLKFLMTNFPGSLLNESLKAA